MIKQTKQTKKNTYYYVNNNKYINFIFNIYKKKKNNITIILKYIICHA